MESLEAKDRFRLLAEVSPVGIFSTDAAGRTTFVNPRWCELTGLSPESALGDGWISGLHPEDRPRVVDGWATAVREGQPSSAEFRFVRADGEVVWLVGQSRPIPGHNGTPAGHVGCITDVTSLRQSEAQRQKLEAHLRQSTRLESLGTLAAGIAHDFNNILAGIFGFLELARLELPSTHPAAVWLDKIAGSSQRARDLVRQILVISRKDDGDRTPQLLQPVIEQALRLLRASLPSAVTINAKLDPATPPVEADAGQIQQLVANLCTNARHALPPKGGHIAVTLEPCDVSSEQAATHPDLRPGPWVRLAVTDDGCGMEPELIEHIFDPFFTTRGIGAGLGLGLSAVHGIVRTHHGAILVHSTPGSGATFEVFFPPTDPVRLPDAANAVATDTGRGERILVVDDDTISGFAIEKLIASLGYRVTRYVRPEEALATFTHDPLCCELVVTDLAMPGMNGAELTERLHRVRADLPVIVVTGFIEPARLQALSGSAARAVLQKPVSRDDLAATIARHLPRRI